MSSERQQLGRYERIREYVIKNESELRKKYGGQFIALYSDRRNEDVRIVDSDDDKFKLNHKIWDRCDCVDKQKSIFVLINTIEKIVNPTIEEMSTAFEVGE